MAVSALGEASAALARAGLLPTRGVRQRLLALDDLTPLLEAARQRSSRGLLDAALFDDLLAASTLTPTPAPQRSPTTAVTPPTAQLPPVAPPVRQPSAALTVPQARSIAPLTPPNGAVASRPHGLPTYDLDDFPTLASEVATDLSIHFDITNNSTTEARMQDIQGFFIHRISSIRTQLERSGTLPRRFTPILDVLRQRSKHRTGEGSKVTICGLVSEPRSTKNGHFTFLIEDETAELKCLIRHKQGEDDDAQHAVRVGLMPDDVVGVTGQLSRDGDLLYISDLHLPPLPRRTRTRAVEEEGVSVAFLSDIHVGSRTFLEAQWHSMVKWFHQDPLARTIKYLILSGDVVDGIGVYPGQEGELSIPDLFNQYSEMARLLDLLPEWVEVLLLPGNHDAVRPAEPQPALDPEVQTDYNRTTFVGNPCDFSLHGVRLLSYHGKSIDDFVSELRNVSYAEPVVAMKEMLWRRHLAPSWGGKTPLAPEAEDHLVISQVPDIFVTGHVHGHHCVEHRGTTLVCSSTWQDQTSYQRMLGFQPKPCILTVVNLHTHATASVPFA